MALLVNEVMSVGSSDWVAPITASGSEWYPLAQIEMQTMKAIQGLLQRQLNSLGLTAAVDPGDLVGPGMIGEYVELATELWGSFATLVDGFGIDTLQYGLFKQMVVQAVETSKQRYIDVLKSLIGKNASATPTYGEFFLVPDYIPHTGLKPPAPYLVQFGDVRSIITELGGGSADNTVPLGTGISGGQLFKDVLGANGVSTDEKLWLYGETARRTFNGHLQIDGLVFSSWEDDALDIAPQDYWLRTLKYRPGDHWGCACVVVPYVPNFGDPFEVTFTASATEEFYDASQPRDKEGQWTRAGAGSRGRITEVVFHDDDRGDEERTVKHMGSLAVADSMGIDARESLQDALDYSPTGSWEDDPLNELIDEARANIGDVNGDMTVGMAAQLTAIYSRYQDDYKMMDKVQDLLGEEGIPSHDQLQAMTGISVASGFISFVNTKWAESSGNPTSMAMQFAVAQEMGLGPAWDSIKRYNSSGMLEIGSAMGSRLPKVFRDVARATYKATQDALADNGVTEIEVFRGVKGVDTDRIVAQGNPLSSWTTHSQVAETFGGGGSGRIYQATVPASQAYSLANVTGNGALREYEIVMLGRPITATLVGSNGEVTLAMDDEVEIVYVDDPATNDPDWLRHHTTTASAGYDTRQPRDKDGRWTISAAWRAGSRMEANEDTGEIESELATTSVGFRGVNDDRAHEVDEDLHESFRSSPDWETVTREELREFSRKRHEDLMTKQGYVMDFGPNEELRAGQHWLTEEYVRDVATNGHKTDSRPRAIQYEDQVVLIDGHHRVAASWLKGERIDVEVIDSSGPITAAGVEEFYSPSQRRARDGKWTTGGSVGGSVGAARKKGADAEGTKSGGTGPVHNSTEFTKKIQDMIDSDRFLKVLSSEAHAERIRDSDMAMAARDLRTRRDEFGPKSRATAMSKVQFEMDESQYDGREKDANYYIERRAATEPWVNAREDWKKIVDPDQTPDSPEGIRIKELVQKHLASEDPYSDTEISTPFGKLRIKGETKRVSELNEIRVDASVERSSTRIGGVVRDEIKSRSASRWDIKGEKERFDSMMSEAQTLASRIYGDPDQQVIIARFGGVELHTPIYATKGQASKPLFDDPNYIAYREFISKSGLHSGDWDSHLEGYAARLHNEVVNEVLSEVRSMGGISRDTPKHRANKKGLSSNQQALVAVSRMPTDWVVTSDNYPRRIQYKQTEGRAHYADRVTNSNGIDVSELTLDGSVSTATHEMGHRMERAVPSVKALEEQFYLRRTANSPLEPMGPGYGKHERTRPDEFHKRYVGKDYGMKAYEVVSMGFEGLHRRSDWSRMDPDYQAFILGVIATTHRSDP